MTNDSIQRILTSYDQLSPRLDSMVTGFYTRLFETCPEVRPLFKQDMTTQRGHLAATLALLVRNIQYQDVLEASIMELGAHHVKVGVRPEHYPVVRDALLYALANVLGPGWSPQLHADWSALLDHIISVMLRGGAQFSIKEAAQAAHPPILPRP
jgi:hemoglobin-like flavoprotein